MRWLDRLTRPSRARFARIARTALKRYGAEEPLAYDPATFSVAMGDGGQRLFLDNAYKDYCQAPFFRRREVLAAYFNVGQMFVEIPAAYAEAKPDLLPKVRERFWGESLRLHAASTAPGAAVMPSGTAAAVSRPLTDEYVIELVWDQPLAMASVSEATLAGWGVGFEQALEDARENLWSRSKPSFLKPVPGLYVSAWRDAHDASRVVLPELLRQLDVAGDPVAFLPNRDCLIVTGSEDEAGLIGAAALAEKELGGTRPMSGVPLRFDGRDLQVLAVPDGHAAASALRNLALFSRAQQYAEQKALLDRADAHRGGDVFHAECTLVERPDGSRYTYCVWVRDVPGTIPETDRIVFVEVPDHGEPRGLGQARSARVREVMGEAMRRLDHFPPRWAVEAYPTDAQLRSFIEPDDPDEPDQPAG